jgi:hypothetical protein
MDEDRELSDEELVRQAFRPSRDSRVVDHANLELQRRMGARQEASARALVTATEGLVKATARLMWATWVLVGFTVVLGAIQVAPLIRGWWK